MKNQSIVYSPHRWDQFKTSYLTLNKIAREINFELIDSTWYNLKFFLFIGFGFYLRILNQTHTLDLLTFE